MAAVVLLESPPDYVLVRSNLKGGCAAAKVVASVAGGEGTELKMARMEGTVGLKEGSPAGITDKCRVGHRQRSAAEVESANGARIGAVGVLCQIHRAGAIGSAGLIERSVAAASDGFTARDIEACTVTQVIGA